MAVTASGLFVPSWLAKLNATAAAWTLVSANNKIALFSNTITPNFSTDTAYGAAPYNANEVTGTNWAAGGVALAGQTLTESPAGSLKWTATNISVASVTFTGARCGLIYDSVLATKYAIALVDFGADYSPVAGTFAINWNAAGILVQDITP
jgi:hypothetical protein